MHNGKYDVLIIGAGLSGLVAARRLAAGKSVKILEAREVIGGRIIDFESMSGRVFSLGGDWFGLGETRLNHLLDELGLERMLLPESPNKKMLVRLHGETAAYDEADGTWLSPIFVPKPLVSAELSQVFAELTTLAKQVSPESPHLSDFSDTLTLDQWCEQRISDPAQRKLFAMVVKEEVGRELHETSLLAYLYIYRSSVQQLGDDHIVVGGTRRMIEALAAELQSSIKLNAPVTAIWQDDDGVTVQAGEELYSAESLILAIPPTRINSITFEPPLPTAKQQLYANMRMGNIIKCVVTYRTPFWYEQGLSGSILSDEGILECVLDATFQTETGALIGYIIGDTAVQWSQRTQAERREAVLQQLATFLGAAALDPLEYVDVNWLKTPFIDGAYYGSTAPNALKSYGGAVRESVGRIHFAGTESSAEWVGTLEGAVLAGERAAKDCLLSC